MTRIAFADIETNGLLKRKKEKDGSWHPPMDKVHCTCAIIEDSEGGEEWWSAADQPGYLLGAEARGWKRCSNVELLKKLEDVDIIVGHNWQDFDGRAIKLVYKWWSSRGKILDTLILSRAIYPDIHRSGPNGHKLFSFEKRMHSLMAWGKRLGEHKGDYKGGWMHWSEEMQAYMEQDVVVLRKLFRWLMAQKPAAEMVDLEHDFAAVIRRQESWGWAFNYPKAITLLTTLNEREARLESELIEAFGSWWDFGKKVDAKAEAHSKDSYADDLDDEDEEDEEEQARRRAIFYGNQEYGEVMIPTKTRRVSMIGFPDVEHKRFSASTGKELKSVWGPPRILYEQGHPYTPVKRKEFNPSSRQHIYRRLMKKYDWKPIKFTPGGKKAPPQPKVDEDVLKGLPYPEAQKLADYMMVLKRLGQLAVGKKAWLKVMEETEHPNGERSYRIHGRVNTGGAIGGRCTHMDPNVSQTPAADAEYGPECRELWEASPGFELHGHDGAALELRMLAHFIYPWDKGEYAEVVHTGDKAKGTDPHSWLRDLIGTDLLGAGSTGRSHAKTLMYADLYGAGNLKAGSIVIPHASDHEKMELGREIKAKMAERFTAKATLQAALSAKVETSGHLIGLDGRKLSVRKAHASLNLLLQSAGALVMKRSLVILDRDLQANQLRPNGHHYEFCGNIHDEVQADVRPECGQLYDELALASLPKAGKSFRLYCPIVAEMSVGQSWRETH